jgi:hypothetical protein
MRLAACFDDTDEPLEYFDPTLFGVHRSFDAKHLFFSSLANQNRNFNAT